MKRLFAVLAFAVLAACAAPAAPPPPAPPSTPAAADAALDPAACAAHHGTIRPVCRMQRPACVIAYADAGRPCRNRSDCEGRCLLKGDAPTDPAAPVIGRCQATSDPCGCRTEVDGGKVAGSICVD